ncbi:Os12g0218600 [Oryza sativa Japonica Group]|uniref:Os12g0218600 protein n=2 Tax=Oryza TaxID=4527 RepID=A0A0P0Y872_ORYSJ|nr:Os12g0218600 [Oryza sativa Japonica Group]
MPSRSRTRGGDGDGDGDGLPAGDLKPGVIRNLPTFSRLLINKWPPVFRQRFSYPFR